MKRNIVHAIALIVFLAIFALGFFHGGAFAQAISWGLGGFGCLVILVHWFDDGKPKRGGGDRSAGFKSGTFWG